MVVMQVTLLKICCWYGSISSKEKLAWISWRAYRKNCFKDIGGLKTSIGWDTVDVLLAKYHNWKTITDTSLKVKHLKPTGATYSNKGYEKQGEAMYKMDYGFVITCIASLKIAIKRSKLSVFVEYLKGYFNAKNKKLPKLVTQAEGKFIRAYRWQGIKQKLFWLLYNFS